MTVTPLASVSAFAGTQFPHTKGIAVRELDGLGIATLLVRKGQSTALTARLRERYGIELPQGPKRASSSGISLLGTGPGTWLAIREGCGNELALSLRDAVGGLAAVVDQSDGLAIARLSGKGARNALCKLFAIDLDARAFEPGDVAVTPAGDIGATLWRVADVEASPTFEIAVHRSYAASFRDHLAEAMA